MRRTNPRAANDVFGAPGVRVKPAGERPRKSVAAEAAVVQPASFVAREDARGVSSSTRET